MWRFSLYVSGMMGIVFSHLLFSKHDQPIVAMFIVGVIEYWLFLNASTISSHFSLHIYVHVVDRFCRFNPFNDYDGLIIYLSELKYLFPDQPLRSVVVQNSKLSVIMHNVL